MQKILLVFSFILLLDATQAASLLPRIAPAITTLSAARPHPRFKERKGTMGFVYGVVLGPVGYFGVKLFSRHNELMCYQAGRGFKIWGLLVASCLIFAGCAALGNNSDPSTLLAALWANP